jgi:hypothetical protein
MNFRQRLINIHNHQIGNVINQVVEQMKETLEANPLISEETANQLIDNSVAFLRNSERAEKYANIVMETLNEEEIEAWCQFQESPIAQSATKKVTPRYLRWQQRLFEQITEQNIAILEEAERE